MMMILRNSQMKTILLIQLNIKDDIQIKYIMKDSANNFVEAFNNNTKLGLKICHFKTLSQALVKLLMNLKSLGTLQKSRGWRDNTQVDF